MRTRQIRSSAAPEATSVVRTYNVINRHIGHMLSCSGEGFDVRVIIAIRLARFSRCSRSRDWDRLRCFPASPGLRGWPAVGAAARSATGAYQVFSRLRVPRILSPSDVRGILRGWRARRSGLCSRRRRNTRGQPRRHGSRIQPCAASLMRCARTPSRSQRHFFHIWPIRSSACACCWRICGIGPVYPDGSEEPNPFDPEGPAPWPLTEREREQAGYIAAFFHRLVLMVVAGLCDAGVPLDPEWAGDQAVCAVLLLLPALGYEIPWDGKIDEFAAMIQPPGVSAFARDGRSTSARDGRPDAMARNADRIRKHIRAENGGRELRVPYAQGTGRALPRATVIRREVLAEIMADNPTVTVSRILMTYDMSDRTPGGRLRRQLKQRLEAEGQPVPDKPSQSVLYEDLTHLSDASTSRD